MADEFNVENMDPNIGASDDDRLWAALAYVFTPLVPIIILLIEDKKNRPFIRAHNVQALIWGVLMYVIGSVTSFLLCIPWIVMLALTLYWAYQAYQGKTVEIPVISKLARDQGWA